MPRHLDPATHEALAERLRFYRDLGLTDFYRRDMESSAQSMIRSWAGAWVRNWRSARGFRRLRLMPLRTLRLRLRCNNQIS